MAAIMADEEDGVKMDDQLIMLKESLSLLRRAAASGKLLCFEEGCCPSEISNKNVFLKNISVSLFHSPLPVILNVFIFSKGNQPVTNFLFFPLFPNNDQTPQRDPLWSTK